MNSGYRRFLQYLLLPIFLLAQAAGAQGHLIISQLYGGGGNTGSVYSNDFVELYNPTNAAIDLSTYSLQYAAVTGTFSSSNTLPLTGSVQAGHYFLIKLASGATTPASLPTPDLEPSSHVLNLSGTGGKLALVPSTTTLASGCPAVSAYTDFVGWGTANGSNANCSYNDATGADRAPVTTNSTGLSLNSTNTWTGVNSADYVAGTPNPRNSSYSTTPVTTLAIAGSSATPASITAGDSTVLSVTVTPGTATTSVTATVDLSSVGGSATQPMALGATANTYTYTFATSGGLAANTYTLPVTVTDNTSATASQNISLKVVVPVVNTPIATIQASRSTYVGNTITFNGVITTVVNAGYYLQTPSSTPGSTGDEGIYVYSGSGRNPAGAVVGNNVTVTGTLTQYPLPTVSHTPSLEVTGASLTVNSTGNPLPAPIVITAPTATGGINQLRQYESMLVSLPSMTAVGGTDATLVENTETTTSNGQFYVVGTGTPRPFREPGMDFRDFPSATCPTFANCPAATNPTTTAGQARPANLTLYDDNSERLIIESSLGGGTAIDVTAGAIITGATGVVDYTYSTDYPYGDPARIILSAANRPTVTASPLTVTALPLPAAGQFTVAAFNVERFFDTNSANDVYYNPATGKTAKSSAVDVTADAYARRVKKFSLAVRTVLNNPDIISVEEVENIQVLKDMAAQIDADTTTGTKPGYVAYGTDSTTTYTNDVGGISVGFLVKPSTVNVTAWEQKGVQDLVPTGTTLNDRPSQVLHATINRGTGTKPYPITVISNHLRSLNDVNTAAVQTKKELQAEMLANLIQGYQQAGEHVIAVGDMNAFQFSDGYTDTLGTITGNVGNGVAVMPGKAIVSPAAVDLMADAKAQSYTEWGNAQVLDHAVVTADIAGSSSIQVGHIDADFPVSLYNDATTPAAMSDHDPILTYLALPAPVTSATLTGNGTFATAVNIGLTSTGQQLTLTNTGETTVSITGFTVAGDFSQSNNCGSSLAVGASCAVNVVFKPTAVGTRTGSITLAGSATVAPVTLTGTGLLPQDFSLGDSSNNTTTNITLNAGDNTTLSLKFSSLNGFAGSITLACAANGTAPTGVACTAVTPVTLTAGGTATGTVVITTVARTLPAGLGMLPTSGAGRVAMLVLVSLVAMVLLSVKRYGRLVRSSGLLMLLCSFALGITGCSTAKGTGPNPSGTPAGTYTYTVTATSGTAVHKQTVNLTVN
jgi:endonuclease/exonuclease/phosphatase family metal-dependent hydrolase